MKEHSGSNQLYGLKDVAQLLGISIWTVRAHTKRGSLRATRIGKRMLVSGREIERVSAAGLPSLSQEVKPAATA